MRKITCSLWATGLAFLFQTAYSQSTPYQHTLNWLKTHHITLNDPTPPKGYQKLRDCDSNVVYKRVSGDTITYYTLWSYGPQPLGYLEMIQSKPYFNVTVYPKSVQPDGTVVMADQSFYSLLARHDSLYALDRAEYEAYKSRDESPMAQGAMLREQLRDSSKNPMEVLFENMLKNEDERRLLILNGPQRLLTETHPPRFQLFFYKDMFRDSTVRTLYKIPVSYGSPDTISKLTISLERQWKQAGTDCYLLSINDGDWNGTLDEKGKLLLTTDGRLLDFENCQVNKKEAEAFVQSFKDSVALLKVDSMFKSGPMVHASDQQGKSAGLFTPHALVEAFGKRGMINKQGEFILPVKYDYIRVCTNGLALVTAGGKAQLVDSTGKAFPQTHYDNYNYSMGLITVSIKNKWGAIDTTGREIIPCIYDALELSYNGWLVRLNGLLGFLSKEGKEVIPIKYHAITNRSRSFLVKLEDKYGLLDSSGKEILPVVYDGLDEFSEGVALAMKGGKLQVIDSSGKEIFPFIYDEVESFRDGWAKVSLHNKVGYVDKSGKVVLPIVFDDIDYFDDGLAVAARNGLYGMINRKGEAVIPFQYDSRFRFKWKLAVVERDGWKGVIDKTGKLIVPCKYERLEEDQEGNWIRVELNETYGYYNNKGQMIIPVKYTNRHENSIGIAGFYEGLAAMETYDKWGYFDLRGKIVIPLKYEEAERFEQGVAKVKLNGKWGYIDHSGKETIPVRYDTIKDFSDGWAPASIEGKWGLIDKNGRQVIPFLYDDIESFKQGLAAAKLHGKWGFIDKSGREVIPFVYDRASGFEAGKSWY